MSNLTLWSARILSGIAYLFLAMDGVIHIARIQPVLDAFQKLSIPPSLSLPLGVLELVMLALYAYPASRVLGAILWTGYLGGAAAIHLRAGSSAFEIVFPIIIGAMLWIGLYLTDERVRALL
jgi:hypothetical protein